MTSSTCDCAGQLMKNTSGSSIRERSKCLYQITGCWLVIFLYTTSTLCVYINRLPFTPCWFLSPNAGASAHIQRSPLVNSSRYLFMWVLCWCRGFLISYYGRPAISNSISCRTVHMKGIIHRGFKRSWWWCSFLNLFYSLHISLNRVVFNTVKIYNNGVRISYLCWNIPAVYSAVSNVKECKWHQHHRYII